MTATTGGETDHPLQIERPAVFSKEVVELDDERNAVGTEESSGVELCMKESPSLV